MSNSLLAPETSSPPKLVRSFGAVGESNHVSSATSKAKPKAITATALAQRDRADPISQPIVNARDLQNGHHSTLGNNGVLNDHGSSDPNTPRLPPTNLSNSDLDNILLEAAVPLGLPVQLPADSVSSQLEFQRYPYPSSGAAGTSIFSSSLPEPSIQTLNKPTASNQKPSTASHNQDIKFWLKRSQQAHALPPNNETTPLPYILRNNSYGITKHTQISETWVQEAAQMSAKSGTEGTMAMRARKEAFSEEKRNRSSSRSSQTRVEKRIEATMTDAEPSSHARSRKSSHVLGLFKENKSSHDSQKDQERQRTTSDDSINASPSGTNARGDETFKSGHGGRPVLSETHDRDEASGYNEEPLPPIRDQEQRHAQPKKPAQLQQQLSRTSSPARSSAGSVKKSRSDTDLTVVDWMPANPKRQEKADISSEHKVPPRLLDEIRDYHNLTTPFHDKFRSTQPKSTGINLVPKDKETANRHREAQVPGEEHPDKADLTETTGEPENEEEEESEHISSALYYPHQAPSPDALEDISIDDARKRKDTHLETEPDLPDPALPITAKDEKPEDVDIALQVHNKNRYLHGDLQKARPSSVDPDSDGYPEATFLSTSDSEDESLDETKGSTLHEYSSPTDDDEATPRASPKTRQSYLLNRARKAHRGPKAPLGAVELKPYNHQVGGHTTVFRFSKRAVCKQLTNRENEFYEVIEREHPEFLKFLPRCVDHDSRPIRTNLEGRKIPGMRIILRILRLVSFTNRAD